jgi:hypothetical protein
MTAGDWGSFDEVARLLEGSVVGRIVRQAAQAVRRSISGSRVLAGAGVLKNQCDALPPGGRIRLLGLGLVSFAASYLVLMLLVPSRVAPLYPAFVWATAGLAGTGCIVAAEALAIALRAKRRRQPQNAQV